MSAGLVPLREEVAAENVAVWPCFLPPDNTFFQLGCVMKNVRDIMSDTFHTLFPEMPLSDAIMAFREASRKEGRTIFGMMVLDDRQRLVGILSMYDILLAVQPKHIHIWGEMRDIDVDGLLDNACQRCRSVLVGDIMSPEVTTIPADAHLFMVLEVMNKKHIRRLPVVDGERVVGMVYISDLFHHLLERLHGGDGAGK